MLGAGAALCSTFFALCSSTCFDAAIVCLVLVLARVVLYLILVAGALSRRACEFDAGAHAVLCLLTTGDRVVVSLLAAGACSRRDFSFVADASAVRVYVAYASAVRV